MVRVYAFHNITLLEIACRSSNVPLCRESNIGGHVLLNTLLFVCLIVWCLTTHQPLWVISVRRY